MIKIAEHRIQKYGSRGFAISFPTVFVKDNELKHQDPVSIYRTKLQNDDNELVDALIIIPSKFNGKNINEPSSKSQES